ncbi:MAG: histidine--tRNA ligase [Cyclobacteriaceae bacterium]
MSKNRPSLPKGTRDFGPEISARRNYIIDRIRHNFRKYGFSQLETPSMENLSTLTGKYGDEGDQLIFKILNSGDFLSKTTEEDYKKGSRHIASKISEKGLRYDLTVPFARYVVMNQNDITFPFKRFQIQPVWRADRPQKGRYREFYQCDADIIGSNTAWNEAELTLMIGEVFSDLMLDDYVIKINHREILFQLAKYVGLEGKEIPFCAEIDKLDKIGVDKVMENVIEIGADNERLKELTELFNETNSEEALSKARTLIGQNKGIDDVSEFFEILGQFEKRNVKVELDLSLARGLSYYTGIIFEVKPTSVEMGSICGGGRYDDLTGIFGLGDLSGVGISFGLDRIYDVISELNLFPEEVTQTVDVLILHFNKENQKHGQKLVMELRENGIKAELYPDQVNIKKQFNYADKVKVPTVVIIGDDEMSTGNYSVKNMVSGDQEKHKINELIQLLKGVNN